MSKKKKLKELYPNYTILTTRSPRWTFSETTRFFPKKNDDDKTKLKIKQRPITPGPGHYKMSTFMGKEGPSFSFSKDKYNHSDAVDEAEKKKPQGPDPGVYYDIRYRPDTPLYTHGKRRGEIVSKFKKSLPPPGSYNPKYDYLSTNKTMPYWGFGPKSEKSNSSSKEKKIVKIEFPGPGSYKYNNGTFPEGPKFTMGNIIKKRKGDNYPGPGTYETIIAHLPTESSYSMGKKYENEHIKQVLKDNYPGPGSYKIKDVDMTKEITFPKDDKNKKKKFDLPGPGFYKIPTAFDYINDYTREKGSWNPTFRYV